MKKKQLVAKMMLVMKFTAIQLLLILLFVNQILAFNTSAQVVLDKSIKIEAKDETLRSVIIQIQNQTNVKFIFSSKAINTSRKISFKLVNNTLSDFFDLILKPLDIGFKIIDNSRILLFNTQNGLANKKNDSIFSLSPLVINNKGDKIIISGIIKDSTGKPLEGVTIKVKNRNISTVSDKSGHYIIKIDGDNATLSFSYVGYATKEIKATSSATLNISMVEIASNLNEIVVIGYGSVKKKDLTGSVVKVEMSDLQKAPVRSFDEALAGRVAGVQVSSVDGQPGAAVNIVIRGNNSITQDNSPLYVVDGFPIENPNNNIIDPSDIESIEILKDASATAIYGSRGANGVIIITTKKGKLGVPVISFDTYYGNQKNLKEIPIMGAYDFVKYQLELNPSTATSTYLKSGKTLESYKNISGTDWQKMMFRNSSMSNAHLAINGGTDKTKYSISGSAFRQNGIIYNSDYSRYQGRVVLDQTINTKLKVGVNVNFSNLVQNGVPPTTNSTSVPALMSSVWGYRPVTGDSSLDLLNQLFDPSVDPNTDYRSNPIITVKNQLLVNTTNSLVGNAYIDYNITNSLKLRTTIGIVRSQLRNDVFNNSNTRSGNATGTNGVNGAVTYRENNSWVNENTLTYNKKINRSQLNLVGGCTLQGETANSYGFSARQIPLSVQSLGLGSLSAGTPYSISSTPPQSWELLSFLSRANYTIDSKYLFTASFRADGSSKFVGNNRWGYFPSVAFAWRISNESFAKKLRWLSDAKLRTSFGKTGNNRVPNFAYSDAITFPISAAYPFNNGINEGAVQSSIGNANLKWETTTQSDIGLDVSILGNRIEITTDYYRKKTNDLLLNARLRPSSGQTTAYKNIGDVQNEGFEFTINSINFKTPSFSWSSSFNISFNKSKIGALANNQTSLTTTVQSFSDPLYMAKIDQPIAQIIGYVWDGVYQLKDFNQVGGKYSLKSDVPNNGLPRSSIDPGDIKYKDINGDGVVNSSDITVIGYPFPKHIGGLTNNFKYKNVDLNIFFQWSYGNSIINLNRAQFDGNQSARGGLNQFASYINRWSITNQNSTIYRAGGGGPTGVYSSRIVEDGSYIRLKTASIGYNVLSSKLKRAGLKNIRVYASGQNLITWTRYSGYDPEVSVFSGALTPGADYSPYPRARTLILGANITF